MVDLIVPQNAPSGTLVRPELRFDAGWAGRKVNITARWAPGTGYSTYNTLVNGGGILLANRTIIIPKGGITLQLGQYTQPSIGSTVGVFINGVFAYARVGSGSNPVGAPAWSLDNRRSDNIQVYVNGTDVRLKTPEVWQGDPVKFHVVVYWTGTEFKGHVSISALGGSCSTPVTRTNYSPVAFDCTIKDWYARPGTYVATLTLHDDFTGRAVATRTFQIKVFAREATPQPKPAPGPTPAPPAPSPRPTPEPQPSPQPGEITQSKGSAWWPLIIGGGLLLAMDAASRR